MYIAVVALTMLILPLTSIAVEHGVHVTAHDRLRSENIAMVSDLFIAAVLAIYVASMVGS
jgi:hypothetical protein